MMTGTLSSTPTPDSRVDLEALRSLVRGRLEEAARDLRDQGLPIPALDGKFLRPLAAYLSVPPHRRSELDHRFWKGALAVEMVHEASLLHDDILDEAPERRGRPTLSASAGVGPALVQGDHLLTAAYRVALESGSTLFLEVFIRAVERTVAGEIAQERSQGRVLPDAEYRAVVTGKSGELFRAIFSLAPHLLEMESPQAVGDVGARLGCLYQMVDDFLDYCPDARRGKIPLQDFRQGKWTWPLGLLPFPALQAPEEQVLKALFSRPSPRAMSPMEKGAESLEAEVSGLLHDLSARGMQSESLGELLAGWIRQVWKAALLEVEELSRARSPWERVFPGKEGDPAGDEIRNYLMHRAESLGSPSARLTYFGYHGKTFRFASRLFPEDALQSVAGVYAFCRFTDDLVDEAAGAPPETVLRRLDGWGALARQAYHGPTTGIPLLDQVMGEMRARSVPFRYAEELLEGVGMDIQPREYATLQELQRYSFRVASVVGGWLTELFGVHDPWVLERAFSLGRAMQLTNILRDVGEDLSTGRIYLPADRMERHGVDRALLEAMARQDAPVFSGYRSLMEELMAEADSEYQRAFPGIPFLPSFFRRSVAVASSVYRGIHDEIRKNGYDNLNRRAHTSLPRKVSLGMGALYQLQGPLRRRRRLEAPESGLHGPGRETQGARLIGSGLSHRAILTEDGREAPA